jgi:putative FmdB family regulatory protein
MPIYEYVCQSCHAEFEELVRTPQDEQALTCSACGAAKIARKMSVPAAPQMAAASLPTPPMCGQCGGAPGSCQFNQ